MSTLISLLLCLYTLAVHTHGSSDVDTVHSSSEMRKSDGGMPASVVLLLLLMFIALGLIGIRHIRRDYLQQQSYVMAKRAGTMFAPSSQNSGAKSYGATLSPELHKGNIDEYIDSQLYGSWNNAILERLDHYRRSVQHRLVEYLESTPQPVLFESNPDTSVGAFCSTPSIPCSSNTTLTSANQAQSAGFDARPSIALQKVFESQYRKNQAHQAEQRQSESGQSGDSSEYAHIDDMMHRNRRQQASNLSDANAEHADSGYDEIGDADREQCSDSDRELSDEESGARSSNEQRKKSSSLITKVVVLDLD